MQRAIRAAAVVAVAVASVPLRTSVLHRVVVNAGRPNSSRSICTSQMRYKDPVQPATPPFARVFAFPFGLHGQPLRPLPHTASPQPAFSIFFFVLSASFRLLLFPFLFSLLLP